MCDQCREEAVEMFSELESSEEDEDKMVVACGGCSANDNEHCHIIDDEAEEDSDELIEGLEDIADVSIRAFPAYSTDLCDACPPNKFPHTKQFHRVERAKCCGSLDLECECSDISDEPICPLAGSREHPISVF